MPVSVIIPAHNEETVIERTLLSLPQNVQKIVVCNACTDNTANIAKKYAKVVEVQKKSVSYARNIGVQHAKHDKLVFLDADTTVDNYLIPMIINTNVEIGTCGVKPNNHYPIDRLMMIIKTNIHWMGFCSGLIFCTKEMYHKVGGFDESMVIHEDGKFLRSAKKMGKFKILNSYVYNDMRRFRKKGYLKIFYYWVKETLFFSGKDYETIR
tara:strand:+ start:617 stop:1246 length:630 start_codon:yes stop_codon:yes gene_type:complete